MGTDVAVGDEKDGRPTQAAFDELGRINTDLERRLRQAQDAAVTADTERSVAEARYDSQTVKLDALTSALARLHLQIEDLEREKAEAQFMLQKAEAELSKASTTRR